MFSSAAAKLKRYINARRVSWWSSPSRSRHDWCNWRANRILNSLSAIGLWLVSFTPGNAKKPGAICDSIGRDRFCDPFLQSSELERPGQFARFAVLDHDNLDLESVCFYDVLCHSYRLRAECDQEAPANLPHKLTRYIPWIGHAPALRVHFDSSDYVFLISTLFWAINPSPGNAKNRRRI
jgi:hypothetical protein